MERGSVIEARIGVEGAGVRLDRALADVIPALSRERIKALIGEGAVSSLGKIVFDVSRKVQPGDAFTVAVPEATPATNAAQAIPLVVMHEDEHLIVIDKPAGLVVHPAAGNLDGTLVNALLHHCAGRLSGIGGVARPGIVHRIDKDTSGLMVAAKTDRAHEGLAKQFAAHTIDRRYRAIVGGVPRPAEGTIDAPLARSPADRKKIAVVAGGKRAVTHYRTLERLRGAALVECRLETGRTHQIRVHFASIGHGLLGDPVYRRSKGGVDLATAQLGFHRQSLHAALLGFQHPVTGVSMAWESSWPDDMQELFSHLHV
ncbi:RluA family pseudouridine synthase [uncultured Sphingomonas sp.]|uniref:RluA family pseudouridine synthase n=1 Tax=uncultured Sphingomonas sp. TaxID=158754 RepID=UPI0035C9A2DA